MTTRSNITKKSEKAIGISTSPATKRTTAPARIPITLALAIVLVASTLTSVGFGPAAADASSAHRSCDIVAPAEGQMNLSDTSAAVERLYRALFLRSPQDEGLAFWTHRIRSGQSDLRTVAGQFAESEEFQNRYGRLGDEAFVELLYCNVLGRHQQDAGSLYWLERLGGPAERSDVILFFSQSDEFINRSVRAVGAARAAKADGAAGAKPDTSGNPINLGEAPDRLAMVDLYENPKPQSADEPEPMTSQDPDEVADSKPITKPKAEPVSEPVVEPQTNQTGEPTLVWQDEFTSLNSSVWRPEHSTYGDGNNELQCYTPNNVTVRDGALVLKAKKETYTCPNGSTRHVTSGMVRGAVHFEYGQRIEFRVKVNPADENDQRGLWPALWASSWNGGGWPTGGEFDWLEYVGTTPTRANHAIHYADSTGRHRHVSKAIETGEKFSDRWHTIGFDWTDDLVWYLDGKEVQRIDPDTIGAKGNPFGPNARPVTQIKLNFALGGNWPGPLGPTTVDSKGTTNFAIDYVRIYDL